MRIPACRAATLRLLAAAAVASLAAGCAGREAVRRADAAPATRAAAARPALPASLARLRDSLAAPAGTRPIELASEARGSAVLLRVVVPASSLFRADTALLVESGATLLRDWGSELARDPRLAIEIEGHTDEIGRAAYNLEFSRQRAKAVREALIAGGVAPQRLVAAGMGEARPVTAERSIAARERNRRIEIRVLLR
jgi:outer membrane protein OmpA-like peptidoglycan-associated protein